MNERGSGMVLSLLALSVMSLLSVVVFRVARAQVRESVYQLRSAQAYYSAETGLESALYQVSLDRTYKTDYTKSFAGGTFSVAYSTENPPTVTVTGYSTPIALLGAAVKAVRARGVISYPTPYLYCSAANTAFTVDGTLDAYDSAANPAPGSFVYGADVWSNGSLTVAAGAVRVRGTAWYFSGSSPGAALVEGPIHQSTYTATLPYHDGSAYVSANDNLTGLTPASVYNAGLKKVNVISIRTATITPGTYYFSDVTVDGTLNVNNAAGTVTIYMTGNLSGAGSIVSQSQLPGRLLIYGQSAAATYTLGFAAPLHASVEARNAAISVQNTLYGKVVGASVSVTNTGVVHYDKQLGVNVPSRVAWQAGTWSESYDRP